MSTKPIHPVHPIQRHSLAAVEYAAKLPARFDPQLWMRLYFASRFPAGPSTTRMFGNPTTIVSMLDGPATSTTAALLRAQYRSVTPSEHNDRWRIFESLDARPLPEGPKYKLYVSAAPKAVVESWRATVAAAVEVGARRIKVGTDVTGMLRPDKLVVYVADRHTIDELAARLVVTLKGCPAHGVPFTAPLDDTGLLSYGIDPRPSISWRVWLAKRLAAAIVEARREGRDAVAAAALERIERVGVDTTTWTIAPDRAFAIEGEAS